MTGSDRRPATGGSPVVDPTVGGSGPWTGRSHAQLAELARELLMAGHLIDRSGMPHLIARFGREGMTEAAIGEWMAASPVYTKRMQRLLGFEGDTVEVIFKGMQLDVGAPPEFLDFRYSVVDDRHGSFHLDHCGALMDVEPMGEEYVHAMCHTIEDPTFDATATATNPRAQVRPVHRPPRVPADRQPHCEWTVTIEPDAEPLAVPWQAQRLAASRAAQLPLASAPADLARDDGWTDYSSPLDPDLVMERFASATLAAICDEVSLQSQLLSRAYLLEVADRAGGDEAAAIGERQLCGIAGLTTKRLAPVVGAGPDLDGIEAVLAVHPALGPRSYVDLRLRREPAPAPDAAGAAGRAGAGDEAPTTGGVLRVSLGPCPALDEADGLTWPALSVHGDGRGLASAVQCLAPRARLERVDPEGDEVAAWSVRIDTEGEPAAQPDEVTLAEFSTGATFAFQRRA